MLLGLRALCHAQEVLPDQPAKRLRDAQYILGRGKSCDIVLEDPSRRISRQHAIILRQAGEYTLRVTSHLNPVLLNGESLTYGRTRELNPGDVLEIGDYQFDLVQLSSRAFHSSRSRAGRPDPFAAGARGSGSASTGIAEGSRFPNSKPADSRGQPTSRTIGTTHDERIDEALNRSLSFSLHIRNPEEVMQRSWLIRPASEARLPPSSFSWNGDPVGSAVSTTVGGALQAGKTEWRMNAPSRDESVVRDGSKTRHSRARPRKIAGSGKERDYVLNRLTTVIPGSNIQTARTLPPPTSTFAAAPAAVHLDGMACVKAFLRGAEMRDIRISEAQAEAFLEEGGAAIRAAIEGVMAMLLARAKVKEELRASERTMVAARENNPLKLSGTVNEALKLMLDPAGEAEAFLTAEKALADACNDLQMHELALMAGMRAALSHAIELFEPAGIEKRLEAEGAKRLLANRKALLWDAFVAHFSRIGGDTGDAVERLMSTAFITAYEEQLRRSRGDSY
jgi:type VI secretion system FHA domain protein